MPASLQTVTDQIIIDGLAAGHTQGYIAEQVGLARCTVNQRAKRLRPLAEAKALEYFERMIPHATDINIACVEHVKALYHDPETTPERLTANAPLLNQAHKIADRVLQSVGIAPSLAPSIIVQNFISVTGNTIIAPDLAKLFSPASLAQIAPPDEAIDAEWSEMADEDGG